jgi:hypothetical protein
MAEIIKPNPYCHPIRGYSMGTPEDAAEKGCLISGWAFLTRPIKEINRSEEKIWLGRTEELGIYSCPKRNMGRCMIFHRCMPEPEVKVVDGIKLLDLLIEMNK